MLPTLRAGSHPLTSLAALFRPKYESTNRVVDSVGHFGGITFSVEAARLFLKQRRNGADHATEHQLHLADASANLWSIGPRSRPISAGAESTRRSFPRPAALASGRFRSSLASASASTPYAGLFLDRGDGLRVRSLCADGHAGDVAYQPGDTQHPCLWLQYS